MSEPPPKSDPALLGGPIYGSPPPAVETAEMGLIDDGPSARLEKIMMGDPDDREHFPGVLFRREEIPNDDGKPPKDAVIVQGIIGQYGFHEGRLKQSRPEVLKIINEVVTDNYIKGSGGGYTFLALCEDRKGNQWTGEHRSMEALLVLAIGLGLGGYCLPREFWSSLPGEMPYIWFSRGP